MNTHDIKLPAEFRSGNDIPVTQATIKRERMEEILIAAIEADRKQRGKPFIYLRTLNGKPDWTEDCVADCESDLIHDEEMYAEGYGVMPLYVAPQPSEPTIDAPAQVGNVRFGKGVKQSTVIAAAQRHYDYMNTPEKEQERIRKGAEYLKKFHDCVTQPAEMEDPNRGEPVAYAIKAANTGKIVSLVLAGEDAEYKGVPQMRPEHVVPLYTASQPAEPVDTDLIQRWQREHGIAQAPGSREAAMVVIRHDEDGKPTVWCDPEIADLVRALNGGGVATVASCSGHGHRPGNIMLADGRVLVVCKDADEARKVASHFPGINGEAPQPAEPVKLECPKCGADRSKAPCAGELMNCHFKGEAQPAEPVKVPSGDGEGKT